MSAGIDVSNEQRAAKHKAARLKRHVPEQWASAIDALAQRAAGEPVWLRNIAWLERLESFSAEHGNAIACALGDFEIGEKAKELAATVSELLAKMVPDGVEDAAEIEQHHAGIVRELCASVGVTAPIGKTLRGVVSRAECAIWWRRALRKKVARVIEHGAIKLGFVNKNAGAYASGDAVGRRTQQLERNAAMLKKTLVRNEAGQIYSLSELAAFSVANRDVRRGELMTRIRGCEDFAQQAGHVGVFFTLTCPSRFHAMHAPRGAGRATKNSRYSGATPRDAQQWLRAMWARARAKLARMGVVMYGFRVAEPHHDGCPHWHALLWFSSDNAAATATTVIRNYWLSDDGGERGAEQNRVNTKTMIGGGAAGYIAKYIAKNIGGSVDVGPHLDGTGGAQADAFAVDTGAVQGYQRVDAWAATWGIRQFQAIGQPPVTVWRELRRVTFDQVERARVEGESKPWELWGTVHRDGDDKADWCLFARRMGGMGCKRGQCALSVAARTTTKTNSYKETIAIKKTVGLESRSGRWLISRRQAWARVSDEGTGGDVGAQAPAVRAALAAPWTRFNNCTARLGGELRRAFMGRGKHEQSDWQNPAGMAEMQREAQIQRENKEKKWQM